MAKLRDIFYLLAASVVILIPSSRTQTVTEEAMKTILASYPLSNFATQLRCYLDHTCNLEVAKDLITMLRDALEPICDKTKTPNELITIVLHAGLQTQYALFDTYPTCANRVDVTGSRNCTASTKTTTTTTTTTTSTSSSYKCKIDTDLLTIMRNFPDLHPLVNCFRFDFKQAVQDIIVYEFQKAVCKKYRWAVHDLAIASTSIVERLRKVDKRCKNESRESVCKNLVGFSCDNKCES